MSHLLHNHNPYCISESESGIRSIVAGSGVGLGLGLGTDCKGNVGIQAHTGPRAQSSWVSGGVICHQ